MSRLEDPAMDQLFRTARSQNKWLQTPVDPTLLHELYDLVKWGPTSANCCPLRILFVTSEAAKEQLAGVASKGNQDKIRQAPATAILGHDSAFYDKMGTLFPHNPGMADTFRSNPELAKTTAFRNGTLQGAYFMLAARSLGLDCGPMSGFDNAACDEVFFAGTTIESNFLCAIGHGDLEGLFPRLPRLAFDDACEIR